MGIKAVKSLIQIRIRKRKKAMSIKATSVFKDHDSAETQSIIYDKYVVAPVDKASINIVCICKKHYIDCLKIELVLHKLTK